MNLQADRQRFTKSYRHLRRARRLYHYLMVRRIRRLKSDKSREDMMLSCVQKMIDRGLYAKTTGLRQCVYSFVRVWYEMDCNDGLWDLDHKRCSFERWSEWKRKEGLHPCISPKGSVFVSRKYEKKLRIA